MLPESRGRNRQTIHLVKGRQIERERERQRERKRERKRGKVPRRVRHPVLEHALFIVPRGQ